MIVLFLVFIFFREPPYCSLYWLYQFHIVTKRVGRLPVLSTSSPAFVLLGSSNSKESAYNTGDLGPILGLGRPPGERHGNPHQYSCLKNSMGRGAWQAMVHGVPKSWTRLSDFHFLQRFLFVDYR